MIPFNRPALAGREMEYVADAVRSGHASGGGPYTARCQDLLRSSLGAHDVVLTTSGTAALEVAALLLDLGPGDEVVIPSFTFPSTANAFVLRGARPVFVDVRPDTLNIDECQLESALTSRTKAIVVVHYAGISCEMDHILALAAERGIPVVEDNAHGLYGRYKGRSLGTFGPLAALSFHETKNFTCGEGGALIVNDPAYSERAEILCDKGTNRARFFRGDVDAYTWVDLGSSYRPSDILAAYLFAQLEAREAILRRRMEIWDTYDAQLGSWAEANDVQLPTVPSYCEQSYHMYYALLPDRERRDRFIAHLASLGVGAVFHYAPLHGSTMARTLGADRRPCPVADAVSERLVRLPFYNDLTAADQARVVEGALAFSSLTASGA